MYLFFLCSRRSQSFEFVKYHLVRLCSQSLELASLASLRIWCSAVACCCCDSSSQSFADRQVVRSLLLPSRPEVSPENPVFARNHMASWAARELGTIRPQQRVRASQIVVKHRTSVFVETDLATFLRANCLVPQAAAQSRLCRGPASQRHPSGAGRNASTTRTGATARAARGDRNWIVGPSSGQSAKLVARSPAPTYARPLSRVSPDPQKKGTARFLARFLCLCP